MSDAYRRAGVNIQAGDQAVELLKPLAQSTHRPEVLGGLGGFGGLFAFDQQKYQQPVLVSGTDGVGTKLKLAFALNQHHTVGIDLVAMCVNDILVSGAEPLFFLDYIACGELKPPQVEAIVSGIAEGCRQAGCALLGGETAEMPGMYQTGEYDLAGFAVGVVERSKLLTGENLQPGDLIFGFASSGLHSNGFSLVRRLLEDHQLSLDQEIAELGQSVGEALLQPTRIYASLAVALNEANLVKGWSHVTGGGLLGNLPRIFPKDLGAEINLQNWPRSSLFQWLTQLTTLSTTEWFTVFNMGIGLIALVDPSQRSSFEARCAELGESPYLLGRVHSGSQSVMLRGDW